MKRRQEAAEAEERAKKEKEEAERLAAQAAARSKEIEEVTTDRPDSMSPAVEERPGKMLLQPFSIDFLSFVMVDNNTSL